MRIKRSLHREVLRNTEPWQHLIGNLANDTGLFTRGLTVIYFERRLPFTPDRADGFCQFMGQLGLLISFDFYHQVDAVFRLKGIAFRESLILGFLDSLSFSKIYEIVLRAE
jgi:hypothetical protein